jgi:chemotaxis protein CheX
MKAKWINPFISNAIDVIEQLAHIRFDRSDLKVKEDTTPSNDISIIIGVTGFIQGQVVYSLKEHTAQRMAQEVKPNPNVVVNSEFIESSIAEIANIITGRATIELSGETEIIYITPPTVVIGKDYTINFLKLKTISVSLSSRFGTMEINIAIKEGEKSSHDKDK